MYLSIFRVTISCKSVTSLKVGTESSKPKQVTFVVHVPRFPFFAQGSLKVQFERHDFLTSYPFVYQIFHCWAPFTVLRAALCLYKKPKDTEDTGYTVVATFQFQNGNKIFYSYC